MNKIDALKERYRSQLAPFIDLLLVQRQELGKYEWKIAVTRTASYVLASPEQYVSGLSSKNRAYVDAVIKNLFKELLEDPGNLISNRCISL